VNRHTPTLWQDFSAAADAAGLNVQVAVGREPVDAAFDAARQRSRGAGPNAAPGAARSTAPADLAPHYRSAIVLGSAGRRLWERMGSAGGTPPAEADPLDRLTERTLAPLLDLLRTADPTAQSAFPFRHPRQLVPFLALTQHLAWARITPMGILVHPRVGPWFAWRAALLTALAPPLALTDSRESPCAACPAPCVTACPAQAVDKEGFRWGDCVDYRVREAPCRETCLARQACPVGPDFRYGPDQLAYHYGASLRMILRWKASGQP
jgi:hypothetical protein